MFISASWSVPPAIRLLLVLSSVLVPLSRAAGSPRDAGLPAQDCRHAYEEDSPGKNAGPRDSVLFPEDDLFRPLLADVRQPRFTASYQRVRFFGSGIPAQKHGNSIDAGIGGLGRDFGLWGLRHAEGCNGVQVNMSAGVFSQFNLSIRTSDLIDTDYIVGFPITLRRGPVAGRLRVYHESSHLGDEFLLDNPAVKRTSLSFEAIDALVSLENRWARVYAGGG